jgi:hypothetical protein
VVVCCFKVFHFLHLNKKPSLDIFSQQKRQHNPLMMKHTLLLTLFIVTSCANKAQAQFGIQAGAVGILGEAFPTDDGLDKLGGAMGYTGGLFFNARISESLVIQPSVNWLNKQWKDELDDGVDITETLVSLNYIEVPVQLVFKKQKASGFFIGAGPSLLYGISGTRTVTVNGDESSTEYTFGTEEGQEDPLTIAINGMIGYSFGRIHLHLNYSQGLTNQADENKNKGNESHLALRLGYIFGN